MTRYEDGCLAQIHCFADRHNSKTFCQLLRLRAKHDFFNTIGEEPPIKSLGGSAGERPVVADRVRSPKAAYWHSRLQNVNLGD